MTHQQVGQGSASRRCSVGSGRPVARASWVTHPEAAPRPSVSAERTSGQRGRPAGPVVRMRVVAGAGRAWDMLGRCGGPSVTSCPADADVVRQYPTGPTWAARRCRAPRTHRCSSHAVHRRGPRSGAPSAGEWSRRGTFAAVPRRRGRRTSGGAPARAMGGHETAPEGDGHRRGSTSTLNVPPCRTGQASASAAGGQRALPALRGRVAPSRDLAAERVGSAASATVRSPADVPEVSGGQASTSMRKGEVRGAACRQQRGSSLAWPAWWPSG